MKVCPKCQHVYEDNMNFCVRCGASLNVQQEAAASAETPQAASSQQDTGAKIQAFLYNWGAATLAVAAEICSYTEDMQFGLIAGIGAIVAGYFSKNKINKYIAYIVSAINIFEFIIEKA